MTMCIKCLEAINKYKCSRTWKSSMIKSYFSAAGSLSGVGNKKDTTTNSKLNKPTKLVWGAPKLSLERPDDYTMVMFSTTCYASISSIEIGCKGEVSLGKVDAMFCSHIELLYA